MHLRTALATAALLALFLPRPAPAQDAEPAPTLRVQVAPGQSIRLRQRMTTEQTIDRGSRPMRMHAESITDVTVTGLPPADGRARVTWTFDRVHGALATPLFSGTFDSAEPVGENPGIDALGAMGGVTVTLTLSPQGGVDDITGIEEAVAAAQARFDSAGPNLKGTLVHLISANTVREQVAWFLLPTQYPANGTSWTDTDRIPGTSSIQFDITSERSLGAVSAGSVAVDTSAVVTVSPGTRESRIGKLFQDESPDTIELSATCTVAPSDGLPLRHETLLEVIAPIQSARGRGGAFVQTSRLVVARLDDAADTTEEFRLKAPDEPTAARMLAARTRGIGLASVERLEEADRELARAVEIAGRLASLEPTSPERAMEWFDGAMFRWTLARRQEQSDAAKQALETALQALAAAEKAGSHDAASKRIGVLLLLAESEQARGADAAASATLKRAEKAARRRLEARPDDLRAVKGLADALRRRAKALDAAGDYAQALTLGAEAHALADRVAQATGRPPDAQAALAATSLDLATRALRLGDTARGLELMERAQAEATDAAAGSDAGMRLLNAIARRLGAVTLLVEKSEPADATKARDLGELLLEIGKPAAALPHFETALADAKARGDLGREAYNGACAAALVHAQAAGEDKARVEALALSWLAACAADLRNRLAAAQDDRVKTRVKAEIQWLRVDDPDLASLRDLSAFRALFAE